MTTKTKLLDFDDILTEIDKKYGARLMTGRVPEREMIPFLDINLNIATSGGIRYGVSTEIIGESSTGKTTLTFGLIHNAQKIEKIRYNKQVKELNEKISKAKGKKLEELELELAELQPRKVLFVDIEGTYNTRWAQRHGIDVDSIDVFQQLPAGSEVMLDYVAQLVQTKRYGAVFVDSIGGMQTDKQFEEQVGSKNYGGIAKVLTDFYKKVNPFLNIHNIALCMINQTRVDLGGFNRIITVGGQFNEFMQSLRIYLAPSVVHPNNRYDSNSKAATAGALKISNVYAKETDVLVVKNKAAESDINSTKFTIRTKHGIDVEKGVFDVAVSKGWILVGGGGIISFTDPKTGEVIGTVKGKDKAVPYLEDNPEYTQELWDMLYAESVKNLGPLDEGQFIYEPFKE